MKNRADETWRLEGYDTFAGEWYSFPGAFTTEKKAREAAKKRLQELEKTQPSATSGGQFGGIQDRVYVLSPDGAVYRAILNTEGEVVLSR